MEKRYSFSDEDFIVSLLVLPAIGFVGGFLLSGGHWMSAAIGAIVLPLSLIGIMLAAIVAGAIIIVPFWIIRTIYRIFR